MTALLFGDDVVVPAGSRGFMFGNCWLYVCTGNEPDSYAFTFQEDLLAYVSMLGYHPLLLVAEPLGRTSADYQRRYRACRDRTQAVAAATGLPLELIIPWCVDYDPTEQVFALETAAPVGEPVDPTIAAELLEGLDAIRYNQLAPIHARSLARYADRSPDPRWRHAAAVVAQRVELVMRYYNKGEYVSLLETHGDERSLPRHVSTAVMPATQLPPTWAQLRRRMSWSNHVSGCVIKSDRDACGEVMVVADRDDYERSLGELRRQLANKHANRNRPVDELRVLVQPKLVPPNEPAVSASIPGRFGLNLYLDGPGRIDFVCATRQLYADDQRTIHLGSYWSRSSSEAIRAALGPERLDALGELFAGRGYVGPIGFDGMLDASGTPHLIYDCNPRMTGVLPVLAARNLLAAGDIEVSSVASLGYHGAVETTIDPCRWLDDRGLLFHRDRPTRGVIPIPNFGGGLTTRYDLILVGFEPSQIPAVADELRRGGLACALAVYL